MSSISEFGLGSVACLVHTTCTLMLKLSALPQTSLLILAIYSDYERDFYEVGRMPQQKTASGAKWNYADLTLVLT